MILEICVDDVAGLEAAVRGGADRIELCAALSGGGVTPSAGFMQRAAAYGLPVSVMIRSRAGDFVFTHDEADVMKRDIDAARAAGLSGVVLGASRGDGSLDMALLEDLRRHADGMDATLHRAFDVAPDMEEALEAAISLGFPRILTSGGARSALEGIETLAHLSELAKGRIVIMPGAGVRPQSVQVLLDRFPITEIHASCSAVPFYDPESSVAKLGFTGAGRKATDEAAVRELKSILSAHHKGGATL
ncbi:copper homeostasis protein [Agrobacterium sp. ATCC 31749]|uniref:copper homeostasis protein CutC n=1 Tax=unclassified Agrobacterium TaxID=2632611 RepID=UPI00020DBD8A|nr:MULTISPECIES: copper homeostasis protein CutC [unclassified Agrobacterium]EGL66133.1 copper homeostasis protein [Agrobacterium sp. ATCC 31749]QKW97842.1 copper homeostasis protein CutC [Agrobacterium sp. CGMCC 11546]